MILCPNDFCTTNIFKNANKMQRCRGSNFYRQIIFNVCIIIWFSRVVTNARVVKTFNEGDQNHPSLQKNMGQRADCDIILCSYRTNTTTIYVSYDPYIFTNWPTRRPHHRSSWTWSRIPSMWTIIADLKTARTDDASPE